MSLGVLNNLSAMYAESNLNNTQTSLSKTLQQLSSGSKINSGADDAAGLSLVNGLMANSTALAQSQTNAQEGVGLLQVADGALSQVTSLLNRAVTLATEASNGTLNSSQDTAANQEYQSILSEINNIGTTTTYNDTSVFGQTATNIYTGDSSTQGASIDSLNISSLSSSSVGDTGGVMAYSNGANNVFVNLSNGNTNARATDQLNSSGTTSIDVSYLVKGADGSSNPASTTITVGGTTNYSNTANGLISAINNSGLGLSATFTTQTVAGVQGGGAQTGIEISGGQISAGAAASSVSTSGILNPTGIPSTELLTQGQTFAFSQGGVNVTTGTGAVSGTLTVGSTNDTLATLATAIGTATNGKVTATVITNGDGSQSLALGNSNPSEGALTVVTQAGSGSSAPVFTSTNAAGTSSPAVATSSAVVTGVATLTPVNGSNTFTLAGASTLASTTNANTELTAGTSITITNSLAGVSTPVTYHVGAGTTTATDIYTGSGQNSMANLLTTITGNAANQGISASAANGVITISSTTAQTGDNITISGTLTNATNTLGLYSPTDGGAATTGSLTKTEINAGSGASQNDVVTGTMVLSNGTVADNLTLTGNGTSTTYADMISTINAHSATLGVTAAWSNTMGSGNNEHGILLTSTSPSGAATITTSGSTLADVTTATGGSYTVTALNAGASSAGNDVLSGNLTVHFGGQSFAITGDGANTNWGDLATQINGGMTGVLATWDSTNKALDITSLTKGTTPITITGSMTDTTIGGTPAVTVNAGLSSVGTAPTNTAALVDVNGSGSSAAGTAGAAATYATAVLQLNQSSNPASTVITDATDQITGSITLQAGTSGTQLTFVQGGGTNTANTIYTNGTTVSSLVNAINANSTALGLSASVSGTQAGTGAIYLQANTAGSLTGGIIASGTTTLADTNYGATTAGAAGSGTNGLTGITGNAASLTVGPAAAGTVNSSDVLLAGTQIQLINNPGSGSVTDTFIIGANTTGSPAPSHTFYTGLNNNTIGDLAAIITANSDNGLKATASTAGLVLTSTANETGNITVGTNTLADTTLGTYGNVSLGNFGSESDTVSGSFTLKDAANSGNVQTVTATAGETVSQLLTTINGASNTNPYGVVASWQSNGGSGAGSIVLTSTTEGSAGSISSLTSSMTDTAPSVNLAYTASNAYSTGISGDATNKVYDSTAGQTSTAVAGMVANQKSASGLATISYSDGAGQSLSATDLTNQTNAKSALNSLNSAITDVAAQDGYIGAQINTLNAVSSVLSTQQQNVVSAQNAVQATDYATAASNMSKYQILSQTGISALAQANSMSQLVTKLLQ